MAVESRVPFFSVTTSVCGYKLLKFSTSSVAHMIKGCESHIGVLVTSYKLANTNRRFN
jgi:hypothetical protein